MTDGIWAAAIYGAIAGAAGGLIGALLAMPFKGAAKRYIPIAVVVAAVALAQPVIRPLLEPYIGQYLPKSKAADDFDAAFDAEIAKANDPLFGAILKKEPNLQRQLRDEVRQIANSSPNPIVARQSAFAAAQAKVVARLTFYLQRGRDEDLINFASTLNEGLRSLSQSDPTFCHSYLYNSGGLVGMSLDQIRAKFGEDQFNRQQQAGARVVESAYASVPDYDRAIGAAGVERAAQRLRDVVGVENLSLLGARLPASVEEARLACDGTIALYQAILDQENAGLILRHLFNSAG